MAFCKNCGNQIEDNAAIVSYLRSFSKHNSTGNWQWRLSLGIVRLLYPDCRSCLIPCVERHKTKNCQSCRNWSIGQCHHWNFVVHSGRCDRSRHCQHGILRSYEKLDLQMASYYIWLSLQEWPFLLLEGDTVSNLCQVYRRTSWDDFLSAYLSACFLVSMDLCNTDAADDPGWGDSDDHFLRKHKYKKVPYRIPVWICTDETVSGLHYMDIPLWLPFSSKVKIPWHRMLIPAARVFFCFFYTNALIFW